LGRSLDPTNPLFTGGAPGAGEAGHGPITEMRLASGGAESLHTTLVPQEGSEKLDVASQPLGAEAEARPSMEPSASTVLGLSASTRQGMDSKLGDTKLPVDSRLGPSTRGPAASPPWEAPKPALSVPARPVEEKVKPLSGIDFGALDFDLGPTKSGADGATELHPLPEEHEASPTPGSRAVRSQDAPTVPSIDLMFEPTTPTGRRSSPATATGSVPMPEIDLNLPTLGPSARSTTAPSSLEEALSRPTLLGAVGALPDEQAPRLTSNTDQATVPLIDFDLSGTETTLSGRRTETQAGTPLASQMATKLDLARGYIDLGVKDGARELLEEVMRDGTREQRQQAVELIKMVEA
jgi:pilus assembly protein FimV